MVETLQDLGHAPGQRRRFNDALWRWLRHRRGAGDGDGRRRVARTGVGGGVQFRGGLGGSGFIAVRVDHHLAEQVSLLVVAVLHDAPGHFLGGFDGDLGLRSLGLAQLADLAARLGTGAVGADGLAIDAHPHLAHRDAPDDVFLESAGRQVTGRRVALLAEHVVQPVVVLAAFDQLPAPDHGVADGAHVLVVVDAGGVLDRLGRVAPLRAQRVERLAVLVVGEPTLLGYRDGDAFGVDGHRLERRLERVQLRLRHTIEVALPGSAEGQFAEVAVVVGDVALRRDVAHVDRADDAFAGDRAALGNYGVNAALRYLGARQVLDRHRRFDRATHANAVLAHPPRRVIADLGHAERAERRDRLARRLQEFSGFCLLGALQRNARRVICIVDRLFRNGRSRGWPLPPRRGGRSERFRARQCQQRLRAGQRNALLDRRIRIDGLYRFVDDHLRRRFGLARPDAVRQGGDRRARHGTGDSSRLDPPQRLVERHVLADDARIDQRL